MSPGARDRREIGGEEDAQRATDFDEWAGDTPPIFEFYFVQSNCLMLFLAGTRKTRAAYLQPSIALLTIVLAT